MASQAPQCECEATDKQKNPYQHDAYNYTFQCHWSKGDNTRYLVHVTAKADDEALRLAVKKCPYEPKPGPDDR